MPSTQTSQPWPQAPSVGPSQLSSTKRTSCSARSMPRATSELQVDVLDVGRRGLDDHLVLVVVAQAVGVLAVAPVGGPHGGLDVGRAPGTRVEAAQEGRRVEGAGADLGVVGLHDDAALLLPEGLQAADDLLERGRTRRAAASGAWSLTCPSGRKRDSSRAADDRRTSSRTPAAAGRMFHGSVARRGYSRRAGGARARAGQGGATATRAPGHGCDGDASAAPGRPQRRSGSATRLSPRRARSAARAGASPCGRRTARARRAAPRRRPATAGCCAQLGQRPRDRLAQRRRSPPA